jgi:tetratricopeptide (TPR) repeat protein
MLLPHHPQASSGKPTLWLAQAVNALSRVYTRGIKVLGARRRRERDRLIREQVAGIMGTRRAVPEQINRSDRYKLYWHCISQQQLDTFWEQHDTFESRAIRKESNALKQIRDSADGDTESELAGYRQYINEHPNSHFAFTCLGTALRRVGRLNESLAAYQQALSVQQKAETASLVITHLVIGNVLKEMGRLGDAVAEYRIVVNDKEACELSKLFHARVYLHLGDALKLQGKSREARSAWKQAVKLDQTGSIRTEASKLLKA